jgi:diguanylate cyclase (GGDEF)-like protein
MVGHTEPAVESDSDDLTERGHVDAAHAAAREARVLFVDDEAEVRRAAHRLLSRHGLVVDLAATPSDAIHLAQVHRYRVVATDLRMPGMDGVALIRRLRPHQSDAAFLVVTGMPEIDLSRNLPADLGISLVIPKPWDDQVLLQACRRGLRPEVGGVLLLVEDNPGDVVLIKEYVHEAFEGAYHVHNVSSLADALVYLQHNQVNLVLADLGLPDATGPDTARRLASASPESPVLILSGALDDELALESISQGAQDFIPKDQVEPARLKRSIRYALERHVTAKRVVRQAHHDPLTGLANRAMFRERLEHTVAVARRSGGNFAVVIADVDRFKPINDTYGHDTGDALLQAVARRLTTAVRACDTVARFGGDEFALILDRVEHEQQVIQVIQRIQRALGESIQAEDHEICASVSMGVVFGADVEHDVEKVLKAADEAMYRAKQNSGTTFEFNVPSTKVAGTPRLQLQQQLRLALKHGEFILHYQPQRCLRTGKIVALEALLRWQRSDGSVLQPGDFIPILEDSRLVVPVGRWVLETACLQLRHLHDRGFPVRMAVNVSAVQFESDELIAAVFAAIDQSKVAADQLELELTESVLMRDTARVNRLLGQLKSKGVRLSIDDFGTGYSSLAYLNRFNVDALKIDQSFTQQATNGSTGASVARAIIVLGHELGLEVVAEGVEQPEQLAFLTECGCDVVQGYLIGAPMAEWPSLLPPPRMSGS